ncbi:hypothetical protein PGT21_020934 [Puccinia graminis f. sp. tritici]|uniref:Uncharacterized protein n=1 Tax=Puccinia graminis f. sp. tritici TaxID=56615 RepID=A0A5B0NJQ5_PUCGR|nr:hypothetical protein PGT21_020934 [Puccinia graminis f. sp. tritici]
MTEFVETWPRFVPVSLHLDMLYSMLLTGGDSGGPRQVPQLEARAPPKFGPSPIITP